MATTKNTQKTVKLRIAVAIDYEGNWSAAGWSGGTDKEKLECTIEQGDSAELDSAHQEYFITIEVPAPRRARPVELATAAIVETLNDESIAA